METSKMITVGWPLLLFIAQWDNCTVENSSNMVERIYSKTYLCKNLYMKTLVHACLPRQHEKLREKEVK